MPYYDILKELRKDNNITQNELAKMLMTTQRTISNWESGRNEPPYEMLKKYSKIFNVSTDYILGLTENPRPSYKIKNNVNVNNGKIIMK